MPAQLTYVIVVFAVALILLVRRGRK